MTGRASPRSGLALGAVLVLALALRLAGLGWGLPRCYHPDEWIYSWNAAQMLEHGDLVIHSNPLERRYVNPTGFIYATALACAPLDAWQNGGKSGGPGCLDRYRTHRGDWHLVARVLSALAGVGAVALVALAGRELERGGAPRGTWLVASALLAFSPLHVRDSHFGTNDVAASALCALAILAFLRYGARPSLGRAALCGAAIGASIGTKYNTGLLLAPGLATLASVGIARRADSRELKVHLGAATAGLLAAFLALSPGPVIDATAFWAGFRFQAGLARQPYEGQEPIPSWWFHARTLGLALGPVGLVASLAGVWRLGRTRSGLAVSSHPLVHLLLFAPMPFAFARVDVPVLPALALLAGTGAAGVAQDLLFRKRVPRPVVALGLLLVLAPPALLSVRTCDLLRSPDTRVEGEAWLRARIPEAPFVAYDPEGQRGLMPLGPAGTVDPALPGAIAIRMDGPEVVARLAQSHVRYVALTSGEDDEPLAPGARAFLQALRARSELRLAVDAGVGGAHVPYSSEERYAPFERAFERERPGPPVRIYELVR